MIPPVWRVRPASPSNLDAILALEQTIPAASHWSRATWLSALSQDDGSTPARSVFLAVTDQALLGFAVGICAGALAELENIAVSPHTRRQGVGKALCQQIILWSRQAGAQTIELEVRASAQGALALYRSLGFIEQGRRPAYYRDPPEDALLMAAPL